MGALRRTLLTALPKVLLSRLTGCIASMPLPRGLRGPAYRWFARRYGADLAEMAGQLADFRSLARFFQRALKNGARTIADPDLVWPCDGRVITTGPVQDGRITQVKGWDYTVADLLRDEELARHFTTGSQATIYLAPGDYHRVHAPFRGRVEQVRALRGTLFPVNPGAVRSIPRLFPRNARHVFHCRLADGRMAVVVMVGAFNVGGTEVTCEVPGDVVAGDELGRFGFGSTVVVLLPEGGKPRFPELAPETRVLMGGAVKIGAAGKEPVSRGNSPA